MQPLEESQGLNGVAEQAPPPPGKAAPPETGGPTGPEPTRFGDWERRGRCIDF